MQWPCTDNSHLIVARDQGMGLLSLEYLKDPKRKIAYGDGSIFGPFLNFGLGIELSPYVFSKEKKGCFLNTALFGVKPCMYSFIMSQHFSSEL